MARPAPRALGMLEVDQCNAIWYVGVENHSGLPAQSGARRRRHNGMLTEYEVRQRMVDVQNSTEPPLRKVRLLLRLGRAVRRRALELKAELRWVAKSRDRNGLAGLHRLERQTQRLHEDLRREALKSLTSVRRN